jgi:uncharacterized protein (TIGR03086 family)
MTSADHYRSLAARFDETVAAVAPGDWANPSPCEEWTALDVLTHVIGSEAAFTERAGAPLTLAADAEADPVAAWRELRDGLQGLLDDPATAGLEYESQGRTTTLAESVDSFLAFDLVLHRWDIAAAAGLDITIPADDIAFANAFLDRMGELFYSSGASGPALTPPADASPQQSLLARAGRDPLWRAVKSQ